MAPILPDRKPIRTLSPRFRPVFEAGSTSAVLRGTASVAWRGRCADNGGMLPELERRVAQLDEILRPIAQRPVDFNDPNWASELAARMPPTREAGVSREAEAVLAALLGHYERGDEPTRVAVRAFFDRYPSFRWAVHLPFDETSPHSYRSRLVHVAAVDQGTDTRDVLLELWELADRARAAGIDLVPALTEVAAISSDVDRYGMGSTRKILLDLVERARL